MVVFYKQIYKLSFIDSFIMRQSSIAIIMYKSNIRFVHLPHSYFVMDNTLIFTKHACFSPFMSIFSYNIRTTTVVKAVKLFIRGLGFRIYEVNSWIYNIIFNWINQIYIFCPLKVLVRAFKKKITLLSSNWHILKTIVVALLKLKKLGPYELRGLKLPRSFLLRKKPKKSSALR